MPLVINIYNNDGSEGLSRQTAFDKDASTGVSIAGTLIDPTQVAARSKWQETMDSVTATPKSSGAKSAYSTKSKAAKSFNKVQSDAVRSMLRSLRGVDPSSLSPAVRKLWTSAFGNTQGAKTTLAKSTAKSRPGKGRNVAFVHPEATFHGGDDSQHQYQDSAYQYQDSAYQPQGSAYPHQGPQYQQSHDFYESWNRPSEHTDHGHSYPITGHAAPVTQADPFANCPEFWGLGSLPVYGGNAPEHTRPHVSAHGYSTCGDHSRCQDLSCGGYGDMTGGGTTFVVA